jgi:hypothetical protein
MVPNTVCPTARLCCFSYSFAATRLPNATAVSKLRQGTSTTKQPPPHPTPTLRQPGQNTRSFQTPDSPASGVWATAQWAAAAPSAPAAAPTPCQPSYCQGVLRCSAFLTPRHAAHAEKHALRAVGCQILTAAAPVCCVGCLTVRAGLSARCLTCGAGRGCSGSCPAGCVGCLTARAPVPPPWEQQHQHNQQQQQQQAGQGAADVMTLPMMYLYSSPYDSSGENAFARNSS